MPKAAERNLKREARHKHFTGARFRRYVYGTLQKIKSAQKHKRKRHR